MINKPVVVLNGSDLTIEDIVAIGIGDKKVSIDPMALKRCVASRKFLENEIAAKRIIYGVNTSFGPMCNKIIRDDEIETLQVNLIRSHAAGLGDSIKPYIALAVVAVRLNTLLKGYSGVRIELVEFLKNMINAGIAPYIPECGSVGASGDLIHLAHMSLAVIGEGKVYYKGKLCTAKKALISVGLEPVKLSYKEGLALVNGTAAMTAISAFVVFGAKKLLNVACVTATFGIEIFGGIDDAFDIDLHSVKPHPGQMHIAEIVRMLYAGSKSITLREDMHEQIRKQAKNSSKPVYETDIDVQDVYSIRCTPQILAPVYEVIESVVKTVEIEANSTNDNPIIIPEKKKIIHGGNFHGQGIGFAMDSLGIAISVLCNLSERRINKFLDKNLNNDLPEYLIPGTVGLTMGFMGAQYLATSTTAENRHLANPVSIHSISCNSSNQDVVSMGTIAARKAYKLISNAKHILTLEILSDMQAMYFKNPDNLGMAIGKIYDILSKEFVVYNNERVFHDDLVQFRKLLFSSQLFDDLSLYWR
jgi:histidine ammonia-lyase